MTVRLLANGGEAEEIVQDTFVTAFEQLGTLRVPGAVRGWLGQIAVKRLPEAGPRRTSSRGLHSPWRAETPARDERLGVPDLLVLADIARLSGHPAEAVIPLERILRDFPGDSQAPLAALALGRLELDTLDRPAKAATALTRALSLGVPRTLRQDVRTRLVEAYARAGNRTAARAAAAAAYLREYPDGRDRSIVESQMR
jgi:DNA-directed RNA polymerase specialized sigma24 family protein